MVFSSFAIRSNVVDLTTAAVAAATNTFTTNRRRGRRREEAVPHSIVPVGRGREPGREAQGPRPHGGRRRSRLAVVVAVVQVGMRVMRGFSILVLRPRDGGAV